MKKSRFQENRRGLSVIIISTVILLIGIVLGGYLVLKSRQGNASQLDSLIMPKILKQINHSSCVPNPSDKNSDVDHDGLPDWQEQIYGSDPCNPDTDGDGYPDGLEVAAGYDPTKPAPNDKLVNRTQKPRGQKNLTLMLAHFLSNSIMNNKIQPSSSSTWPTSSSIPISSSSLTLPPDIKNQQVLSEGISQVIPYFQAELKIKTDQLKIVPPNQENVNQYRRDLDKIIGQGPHCSLPPKTSEAEIIYQAIQKRNFSTTNCLGDFYHQAYLKMTKMKVPRNILPTHKKQMVIFNQMANMFYSVKGIDQDPLRVYLSTENFIKMKDRIIDLAQSIEKINKKYPLGK